MIWRLSGFLTLLVLSANAGAQTTAENINACPALRQRSGRPTSVRDLRIDDIDSVLAIGTSASAALGARETTFSALAVIYAGVIWEYRGVNFATGGDGDAESVGSFIRHFNPELKGLSFGRRTFEFCFGPGIKCPSRVILKDDVPVQGLNAAQSGAWAVNWPNQMGYFKDNLKNVAPQSDQPGNYKLLIVEMGINDICTFCDQTNFPELHTADIYEKTMRAMLDEIRRSIKNVVVVFMAMFDLKSLIKLNSSIQYCKAAKSVFQICDCIYSNTDKAAELLDEYLRRIQKLVKEVNDLNDPSFAAIYDPGLRNFDFSKGQATKLLSAVDCFHPSKYSHGRVARGIW
ncbi:hypothetical protein HDU97_009778 [Phlyctochytrium planicorne]|nr:hypothetical protein HDU97_009778 [Phlyctochytrium planicorne]